MLYRQLEKCLITFHLLQHVVFKFVSMLAVLTVVRLRLAGEDAMVGSLIGIHCDSTTCKAFTKLVTLVKNADITSIANGNEM